MSQSVFKVAPIHTSVVNISTPAVVEIVLELALINEVPYLATNSLQLAVFVDLANSASNVILTNPKMKVNRNPRVALDRINSERA